MEHGLLLLARCCGLRVADSPLARVGDADRGRWSYLQLADELRRVSAQPAMDLRGLFGQIGFSAAVSNINDHPRKHALLARSTGWQHSPAYDLTPAPMQADTRRDLAMACGLVDRSPSRWANRRVILAATGRFLLKPAEAEAIATRIFDTVASSWEATLREASVSPGDCQRLTEASSTLRWSWIRRWWTEGRASSRSVVFQRSAVSQFLSPTPVPVSIRGRSQHSQANAGLVIAD